MAMKDLLSFGIEILRTENFDSLNEFVEKRPVECSVKLLKESAHLDDIHSLTS
jgi:hypothetical protein